MPKATIIVLSVVGGILILGAVYLTLAPPAIDIRPQEFTQPKLVDDMMDDMKGEDPTLPVLQPSMPAFKGITQWWNTPNNEPLTREDLKGKVTMIKFWTYSCINCIRTYPYVKSWHENYADDGFVLVGVHTPEFDFERKPENVEREIRENDFQFPVALDPSYQTWRNYENRFWPATYLFDAEGRLRYTHFGEGKYDETERAIQILLKEAGMTYDAEQTDLPASNVDFSKIRTRETYFGYERAEGFVNASEARIETEAEYELNSVGSNQWSIGGSWRIEGERSVALGPGSIHRFSVQAPIYNIVLDAPEGTTAKIRVRQDGKALTNEMLTNDTVRDANGDAIIEVGPSRLYRIMNIPNANRHTVEIEVLEGEVRFYAATFG
ncbi:redoxin domain-containing protein [Candidatus Uhrbacteria bacterium]|nr:redoxin domain-containing protein [Candidatus Uhrbacteria bacterium]MBD3284148.1 redoxin domain-containing protein [Candidatus Uhrbacteria bacterium]